MAVMSSAPALFYVAKLLHGFFQVITRICPSLTKISKIVEDSALN